MIIIEIVLIMLVQKRVLHTFKKTTYLVNDTFLRIEDTCGEKVYMHSTKNITYLLNDTFLRIEYKYNDKVYETNNLSTTSVLHLYIYILKLVN